MKAVMNSSGVVGLKKKEEKKGGHCFFFLFFLVQYSLDNNKDKIVITDPRVCLGHVNNWIECSCGQWVNDESIERSF